MEDYKISEILPNKNNDITYERKFLGKYVIPKLIVIPLICELCGNLNVTLNEYNSLANPYVARCTYNKCRKIYFLKNKTFLNYFPKQKVSIILYILKLWLIEKIIQMKFLVN